MEEYGQFPEREFEELLLFTMNLDNDVVAHYFTPKRQKHQEKLNEIFKQAEISQSNKELAVALALLVTETVVRSHIKDILTTTSSNSGIVEKLLPYHRDVEGLLKQLRSEAITYAEPLKSLVLQEKESIQTLLEDLTKTIRQHTPDGEKVMVSQLSLQSSPLTVAVEQAQDAVAEKVARRSQHKKISVTVVPSARNTVLDALSPYVDAGQTQELKELLTKGSSAESIYFNESRVMLGDLFRKLKDKKMLQGVKHYTELAAWLSQHFFFWNKDEGKLTPVNEKSILKVLREGDKPDSPILI